MFSRALSQSARMTSRAMRNSSIKTVVKRHSHDHAGTPQPPYVQRNAPTKSVSLYSLNSLTISFLSMLNWFGKMVLLLKLLLISMLRIWVLRLLLCGFLVECPSSGFYMRVWSIIILAILSTTFVFPFGVNHRLIVRILKRCNKLDWIV